MSNETLTAKINELMHAISLIENQDEALRFFTDLCTPAELEAMADRWKVVPLVIKRMPYREIHDRTGVSVATITRIARCINLGGGGYALIAGKLKENQ